MQSPDLGAFLRSRRAAVSPADIGVATDRPRRVEGLRREEVAEFAGVHVDYYTRLEQGRQRHPSPQVLDALARALHLDPTHRDHLHRLAGTDPAASGPAGAGVDPSLVQLVDQWEGHPAFVLDDALDVLASNAVGRLLHRGFVDASNVATTVFSDPHGRDFYVEWEHVADVIAANLRFGWGRTGRSGRVQQVVDDLLASSPEFARRWERHEVREKSTDVKVIRHPDVGPMRLVFQSFAVAGRDGHTLLVYSAPPGSADAEALRRLTELAAHPAGA